MKHYPYLVYRYGPGIYGNTTINFVADEQLVSKGKGVTICWQGEVFGADGKITPTCREILRAIGIEQKQKSRFRLCIVYGPSDCDYFESGGVINQSIQPPLSTITLGNRKYESEMGIDSGKLDLTLTKFEDADNIEAEQATGRQSLGGTKTSLAILAILSTIIYSGCLTGRAAASNQQTEKGENQSSILNTNRRPTNEASEFNNKSQVPTAICRDGSLSYSASRRGTCSHHGGVDEWIGMK